VSRTGQPIRGAALLVGFVFGGLTLPIATMSVAVSASTVTSCHSSQVRETAATSAKSYPEGTLVKLTVTIRNEATRSCSVAIGPTSPSFSIVNARGTVVWNNCYTGDHPGACAMFLMLHVLKPKASYVLARSWNQRDGPQSKFVARGTYEVTSSSSGVSGFSRAQFTLTS
jgi:hypothetical protein